MFKGTRQNGRTPGTQNKTTKEIRETFKNLFRKQPGASPKRFGFTRAKR
jgi:hypothetical protein